MAQDKAVGSDLTDLGGFMLARFRAQTPWGLRKRYSLRRMDENMKAAVLCWL